MATMDLILSKGAAAWSQNVVHEAIKGSRSGRASALSLSSRQASLFGEFRVTRQTASASKRNRANLSIRSEEPPLVQKPDYPSDSPFFKVEAILRPWRLKFVAAALLRMGIRGVTVSDVRGFGAQGGSRERQAGSEFTDDNFVSKSKLEIVVTHEQVEAVVETIISESRTGEIGDGKIFISPVSDIIRVRTGERGARAERMAGGRLDLLNSSLGSWNGNK